MPKLCIDCAKDAHIKALIKEKGVPEKCDVCIERNLCIDSKDNDFFQLVKALIRSNFSEWDYNHHWGGDGLEALFSGPENIFFYEERAVEAENYEDLILDITENSVYEDYDKGVSLFAGHTDGQQNILLRSLKLESDPRLLKISRRLETENYFGIEKDLKDILRQYASVCRKEISSGNRFSRARIGIQGKKTRADFEPRHHYSPFTDQNIGAPPPQIASAGRLNRPGVSFFYCATNDATAIAEVRPHPGDHVSVGEFRLKRKIQIFDLTGTLQLLNFYKSDKELDSYQGLVTLSSYMNLTIPPSARNHYSITQLIADCVRQLGFDGLLFNSTVSDGQNLVVFDSTKLEYVVDSGLVVEVRKVTYLFDSVRLVDSDDLYVEDM